MKRLLVVLCLLACCSCVSSKQLQQVEDNQRVVVGKHNLVVRKLQEVDARLLRVEVLLKAKQEDGVVGE